MAAAKRAWLALTLAVFAASWVHPLWPAEQAMHSSLAVLGIAWLVWHDRRWPLRSAHFAAICLFIGVHNVAAHWLYSNVPYDQWLRTLSGGWSPNAAFGWQRNHTDRLIHLLFGLCFAPALRDYARQRWPALSPRQAFVLAAMAIMCASLLYEWLEWLIALLLSPEQAESYNGQQGDPWDAHMDMLLATLGCARLAVAARRSPSPLTALRPTMSLPPPLPVPGVVHADTLRAESELGTPTTLYAVLAGLQGLMLLMGGFLACGVHREAELNAVGQSPDQAQASVVAIVLLSALPAFGLVSLVLKVLTARALRQPRRLFLCNLTAALTCLGFPLGKAMGVWTLLVLQRPASVVLFRTSGR